MGPRVGSPLPPLQLGWRSVRFLRHLPDFVRLYWRLLRDRRVSIWPKALLVFSLVYLVSPIDLLPDTIPLVGEVDDLIVLITACRLFIYLCPRAVVRQHVQDIARRTA